MNVPARLALVAAWLMLSGCVAADRAVTKVQAVAQAQASPTLSVADTTFLDQASRTGIADVALGQLARTQASRASTRDFALRLVGAQTALNQEITRVATTKSIAPTNSVDPTHDAAYQQLAALHGRAFDRAWLDQMAADHAAMLQLYRTELETGSDPDVRALAARSIGQLEHRAALIARLGGHAPPASAPA